jgi:hypothetical protein
MTAHDAAVNLAFFAGFTLPRSWRRRPRPVTRTHHHRRTA